MFWFEYPNCQTTDENVRNLFFEANKHLFWYVVGWKQFRVKKDSRCFQRALERSKKKYFYLNAVKI